MKTFLLTGFALVAFAGNSILCRLALAEGAIDAGSFTAIRLVAAVVVLWVVLALIGAKAFKPSTSKGNNSRRSKGSWSKGSWFAALMLFIYALGFSYAYVSLDTGTGALILFACVQITIIARGLVAGQRLYLLEWLGVMVAFAGFTYLVLPDISTPSVLGFALMSAAGIGWGFYTLAGKKSVNPLADTAYNFLRTLPLVAVLVALTISQAQLSIEGALLAALSGGLASGIGYTIWYMALEGLSATQAAVLQLLVPVIAAFGGIVFAGEELSVRLLVSSSLILGGILVVIMGKYHANQKRNVSA